MTLATAASSHSEQVFSLLQRVRKSAPLVHHLSNFVTMNFSANAVLALGASPVMAHAREEVSEMVRMAGSVVLNIGTLDESWLPSFRQAAAVGRELKKPVVLDPVGAGATVYRTRVSLQLLEEGRISVVRGNASEVMALAGISSTTKGVDSSAASVEALTAARQLNADFGCVVCVSGETDFVVAGDRVLALANGHARMQQVTGMGCVATSLVGAFLAVEEDAREACLGAMGAMGIAGELAAISARGPGSFAVEFLDRLAGLRPVDFSERLRVRELA